MTASVLSRRSTYVAQTREAILDSARHLFTKQGFDKTSIDQVAAGARISKGAIYHHFPDKRAIFEAVFLASQEQAFAAVMAKVSTESDPVRRVDVAISAFIDQYATDPARRTLLGEAPAALGAERLREYDDRMALPLIRATLDGLPGARLLTATVAEVAARLVLAAMCAAATGLAVGPKSSKAQSEASSEVLRRMVHGLLMDARSTVDQP